MKTKFFFFIVLLIWGSLSQAQTALNLDRKSTIEITGTSTLHDWESEVSQFHLKGNGSFSEGKLTSIQSLSIDIPVKAIKSGKSLMDDKTYEALLADKYPHIQFILESISFNGNEAQGKGKLTIAGKTKEIAIKAKYSYTGLKSIDIKGSQKIDMTVFGVTPPTALMGSITTGKEVIIPYHIILNY